MATPRLRYFLLGHSLPRFILVGGIGFIVDASLLAILHYQFDLGTLPARLCSFTVALTTTWLLNRRFSFAAHASDRRFAEWLRYALINGIGGSMNLAIYVTLTQLLPGWLGDPLVALSIASACALLFNYTGSRLLVFQAQPPG
jgi:putative flippase GtrA